MFNNFEFNSGELNTSSLNNTGNQDLAASLTVNTNPAFATFKELQGFLSVAAPVSNDVNASLVVSNYKWLTPSLMIAQNGPGYRPYYTCHIVDDTIQPNAIITPPNVPLNGSAITAPDGNMLAVGADASGNLAFWKLPDASTGWTVHSTLVANGSWRGDLNASVAVSNWINGSYVIDVYFYANVSGALKIKWIRSTDGGATWGTVTTLNDIAVSNATTDNMYLSAGTPVLLGNGLVQGVVFYIKKVSQPDNLSVFYRIFYQYYGGTGSTFGSETIWPTTVDSQDWTMHSLDSYYLNGSYYIAFAGYHNFIDMVPNSNFSIYSVRLDVITSNQNSDVWSLVNDVFLTNSSITTNQNSFTYPRINYDGSMFYVLFKAVIVDSVSTATSGQLYNVITKTYYYLTQSLDMANFSYPAPLIFSDGTIFTSDKGYDFVRQGSYFFVVGNGLLWKYIVNNVTADITNSIISFEVDEMAGAASTIDIVLGNMNNQWVGPSPTKAGASAIAKNRKIYLEIGYYNSSGVGETVPRNIFYIDDIKQVSDSNTNNVELSGRDLNKSLKVLTTKFAYNYRGITAYSDIFNGATLGNWNLVSGNWAEANGQMQVTNPGSVNPALITLQGISNNTESSIIACAMQLPNVFGSDTSGAMAAIYPIYVDDQNYVQFKVYLNGVVLTYNVNITVNGVNNVITDVALDSSYNGKIVNFLIRKHSYGLLNIIIGARDEINFPGTFDPAQFSPAPLVCLAGGLPDIDFGQWFTQTNAVVDGAPAIGVLGITGIFEYFKYIQFGPSQSIQDVMQKLGSLSSISRFSTNYIFKDTTYPVANYAGTPFPVVNAKMQIAPSSLIVSNTNLVTNGELEFRASILPTVPASDYSMSVLFKVSTPVFSIYNDLYNYRFEVKKHVADNMVTVNLYINIQGSGELLLVPSSPYVYNSAYTVNNLAIDITSEHSYRLVTLDQFFYLFIDEKLVMAWQDNNTTIIQSNFSNGYWGFKTDSNSTMKVGNIKSRTLWNQIENVSVNPGDDITSTLGGILQTVSGWSYADLMGRLTGKVLTSTDPSTYTYQESLYSSDTINSDTQYVNQVTVYGTGVSAIYQDAISIGTTGKVRDMTISDPKITTYKDAYLRAQFEMINANKFNIQNTPLNPLNAGAEILDAITIINTGQNSTNLNGIYREYNQTLVNDGSKGRYSINIQTGQI